MPEPPGEGGRRQGGRGEGARGDLVVLKLVMQEREEIIEKQTGSRSRINKKRKKQRRGGERHWRLSPP